MVETSNLEIGKIYIEEESEGKRRRRRIVVVELHGDTATVKDLDTLAIDVIGTLSSVIFFPPFKLVLSTTLSVYPSVISGAGA